MGYERLNLEELEEVIKYKQNLEMQTKGIFDDEQIQEWKNKIDFNINFFARFTIAEHKLNFPDRFTEWQNKWKTVESSKEKESNKQNDTTELLIGSENQTTEDIIME